MIISKIRSATATQHENLEKRLDLFRRVRDGDQYRTLLELFFGLYGPVEERIATHLPPDFDFESRRKIPSLKRDLVALGLSEQTVAKLPRAPLPSRLPLENTAQSWGVLYVLEGSTLGAQYLTAHFKRSLNLDPTPLEFYSGYGSETRERWKAFLDRLTEWGKNVDEASVDETANAAATTFDWVADWLCQEERWRV